MPLLAVLAVLALLVLYAYLCMVAVTSLFLPSMPFLLAGGVAIGVSTAVVVFVLTLLGAGSLGPPTVGPADAAARLPRKRGATAHPRDDAWPNYLAAQWRDDLRAVIDHTVRTVAKVWGPGMSTVRKEPVLLIFWPLLLFPLTWAVAFTTAVLAGLVGSVFVAVVALAAGALLWLVVVLALRGADHAVRTLRRARATCPHPGCNHRMAVPAFACTSCTRVHHDIRPGRQGALRRRCACDALLPTTVLAASARLTALCQDCGRPLHPGSAAVTDVVIPVFGPTSAGKTRLVHAGIVALQRHLDAVGGTMQPVGADNEAVLQAATTTVDTARQTTKTAVGAPAAITVDITAGRRRALLHLFDAAGESFADRAQAAELRYLGDTEGLVFVLDPFSIPEVTSELRADEPALREAQPAVLDPDQAYQITVQWLRDQSLPVDRLPLAVAVVKADLLRELHPGAGLDADSSSEQVEAWLREKAVDNVVDGAQRDFGEVRFFLVSSLDDITTLDGLAMGTSPARPLLWLLSRSGVTLPERREAVPS